MSAQSDFERERDIRRIKIMIETISRLRPGQQIRIEQTINRREGAWTKVTTGELVEVLTAPTGSWFAHGSQDRYWLLRLRIRKPCGEISLLSLSPDSKLTILTGDARSQSEATAPV